MTYRGLADSALSEAGIIQAPVIFLDFAVPCKSSSTISPFSVCHLLEFLGWEEWVIAHSNFFMIFSDPHMAGLAVQFSLHAMLLRKVFPVPPFYQFLVYAGILHSCSYVAHIKVADAQCCWQCPLSGLLWTTMFSGSQTACTLWLSSTLSGVIVHCRHCSCSLILWDLQNPIRWLSGDKKIPESDFGWTKSSQKSLSRWKWFYAFISFKKNLKTCQAFSGSNESSLAPQFKWLDNTFKVVL